MAISVDTVYQKVLAMANKEQRGYITPQEFNLFANQAQMDIFEQYFYDLDNNKGNLVEEKLYPFKETQEEFLLAEMARLHTLLALYEGKEEFMKAAIIKRRLEIVQNKLDNLDDTTQGDAGPQI